MKKGYKCVFYTFVFTLSVISATNAQFTYISPKPGSSMHQPQTSILLRNGSEFDAAYLAQEGLLKLAGSKSGQHTYHAALSKDHKTIIVRPQPAFDWDESVSVTIKNGLRTKDGSEVEGTSFSFSTRKQPTAEDLARFRENERQRNIEEYGYDPSAKKPPTDEVYDSMTTFKILTNNNPAPGQIFFNNQNDLDVYGTNCFATIIENDGTIAWARDLGLNGHDFKINYNGYLTYFSYENPQWFMLDSNYNKIDSFRATNGYEFYTNGHDFIIYPDGHYYLIVYDEQIVDMSQYVPGGQPNANVTGLVIQGYDPDENLVFEWRSWDYIDFTDANNAISLTTLNIDYVHGNALEEEADGNLLYSSRTCCEIVKLNTQTGDIIWRLGGENNQFTFINDPTPEHFRFQHDVRRLANGHLTLFNNGNTQIPQQSAAKEYIIDEVNKTATLAWYYIHPDVNGFPLFGSATGSMQRLPNGNTLIDWGTFIGISGFPNFTEVDNNKNILWELKFDTIGMKSYRAHKYEWDPCARITGYTMNTAVNGVKAKLTWGRATGAKKFKVFYKPLSSPTWTSIKTKQTKLTLSGLLPNTSYVWKVKTLCGLNTNSAFSVLDTFTTQFRLGSLTEETEPFEVNLYPNPAESQLHISIEETINDPLTVTIVNMMGSEMMRKEFANAEQGVETIDVSNFAPGVYLVSIATKDRQVMKKFVKQ